MVPPTSDKERHSCWVQVNVEDAELLNAWERKRQEYKQSKRLTAHRQKDTLAKLLTFTAKLKSKPDSQPAGQPASNGDASTAVLKSNNVEV